MSSRTFKVSVTGDKELLKNLDLLPKEAKKIARQECRAAAKQFKAAMEAELPLGETGDTQRSVKVQAMKRSRAEIGVEAVISDQTFPGDNWYAQFPEWGTKHQQGQHNILIAFEQNVEAIKGASLTGMRDKIDAAVARMKK